MGNLGFSELLVILAVALLVIGPKRLPQLATALGEAVRAFQEALRGNAQNKRDDRESGDQPGE
jgi:sec-independent protein translocase protein TatA